jgi:tetratricopeptide (TPR) repeat protein
MHEIHQVSRELSMLTAKRAASRVMLTVTLCLCFGAWQPAAHAQNLFEQAVEEAEREAPAAANEQRADSLYFSSRFAIDDADPVKSVPSVADRNAYPVDFGLFLTSLFQKGDAAAKRGDHVAAVKYFLALAQGTPEGAMAFRHLCAEYRALGRLADAQKACGILLSRNGVTLDDSVQFVQLVVTQPEELTPVQVADLDSVIEHLAGQTTEKVLVEDLKCRVGARILDAARLEACTAELRRLNYPADKMSTYVWALAMLRGHTDEAKQQVSIVQARPDADADTVTSMARLTSAGDALNGDMQLVAAALLSALLGGAVIVYLRFRNRRIGSYGR